jgi:thiamine biosynthesis lipoprotein
MAVDHARSVSVRAPRCVLADALTKVVMASADANHAALAQWQATAFII